MPLPTGLPLIVTLCGGAVTSPGVPFNPKITVCPGTDGTVPAGIPDRVLISCGWCQCSVPDLSDLVIPLKFYCPAIPGTVAVVGERDFSRKPAAVGHGMVFEDITSIQIVITKCCNSGSGRNRTRRSYYTFGGTPIAVFANGQLPALYAIFNSGVSYRRPSSARLCMARSKTPVVSSVRSTG